MTLPSLRPLETRVTAARQLPLRAAVLVALVALAYNYSLLTLARGLTLQTPLAYLALVPAIALILAVARLRLGAPVLPIHDRQVDWIVGLGLLLVAAAVLVLGPSTTSSTFWLQRVDLLTLPIFVAALVTLLFGIRRMWALKGPIAFLFLAWPIPYTLVLGDAIGTFTELTAKLVAAATRVVPIARPSATDDTLFFVGTGSHAFTVSIGSACAGVNGFVGFLLVGTAFLYVVRGPLLRRIAWLSTGLALVFGLNVVRIAAILVVGAAFGQGAALDVLHPVAGLVVFNIGVLAMIALVPRFGLRFLSLAASSSPVDGPSPVRRVRPALVVALAAAAVLAATNAAYARYDAISSGLADARLKSFDVRNVQISRWNSRYVGSFAPLAKQYFGSSASWNRAMYWSLSGAPLFSSQSVFVDVLTTDDPGSFAAYSVEACYRFHGYNIASVTNADIGAGVQAQVIDFHNPTVKSDWSTLWWEWPYTDGLKTRYERVVILINQGPTATYSGVTANDVTTQAASFTATDRFLVSLARTIVRAQLQTAQQ